ncbi:MAG: membrane protein insertase YidC [Wenzhouxiangellaceae bacterium]|nr:membrane protein insertase YidC [Wenzhouxiangellaceae bacterium]
MNTRTLLLLLLVFLGFMVYVEWQSDYANPTPRQVEDLPDQRQPSVRGEGEEAELPDLPDAAPPVEPDQDEAAGDDSLPTAQVARSGQRIQVETDRVVAEIDPAGGTLSSLKLKQYPVSVDKPDEPFELLSEELTDFHIAQAGLVDAARRAPNHTTTYDYDRQFYELAGGAETLEVPLTWRDENGLEVIQTWVFERNTYVIEHRFEIRNRDETTWEGSRYLRLQRASGSGSNGMTFTNPERISFNGAAVYSPDEKFQKLKFNDFGDEQYRSMITGGWAGMVQHYFLSAWIPPADQPAQYTTRLLDRQTPNRYALTVTSNQVTVPAGQQHVFESRFFAGPKDQNQLDQVAPGLGLTVDYGIFTVFSKPLFWLLDHIQDFVKNWGLAIILLTLLIKLAFYKLTQAQFRSMGKLRKLQPRIQQLKERYGDDRQKFGQAMMEIYKKEKVNPLGGCLPILVQIPIFIALYWVLLESVELRQAGFLWVPDLSKPDPLFILPVVNGAFMIITQRLTPMAGMDPTQRKIMQFLPVAFAVLFAFFPAGLVLYWASNSGISLLQQWYILRQIDAEEARARA